MIEGLSEKGEKQKHGATEIRQKEIAKEGKGKRERKKENKKRNEREKRQGNKRLTVRVTVKRRVRPRSGDTHREKERHARTQTCTPTRTCSYKVWRTGESLPARPRQFRCRPRPFFRGKCNFNCVTSPPSSPSYISLSVVARSRMLSVARQTSSSGCALPILPHTR